MKKKGFLIILMMFIIGCFTACNFTKAIYDSVKENAIATPKVSEMMVALSEERISDATALMHPLASEDSDIALRKMSSYLNGRDVYSIEMVSINTTSSVGTEGKVKQEQVVYQVVLSDDELLYINALYRSDNNSAGFMTFYLLLGVL